MKTPASERARKASFLKRGKGLLKKAHELSVLCDVPVGLVFFGPDDARPRTWPEDPSVLRRVLEHYRLHPQSRKKDETTKFKQVEEASSDDEGKVLRGLQSLLDETLEEVSARITSLKSREAVSPSLVRSGPPTMIPWLHRDGAKESSAGIHHSGPSYRCDPRDAGDGLSLSLACSPGFDHLMSREKALDSHD